MKTLLLIFASLLVISTKAQNGFTTYSASLVDMPSVGNKQTSIVVDNSNNVWMGYNGTFSNSGRLVKYNATTQVYTVYSTTSTPSISNSHITSLAKDATGNIWIGTNAGLLKYDGVNFTTVGLSTTSVNCIEAIGNQIYVGTKSGLYRYDGATFTNYNVANASLPSDTIFAVKAENANVLWIGNNRSQLVKFNIDNSFSIVSYSVMTSPILIGRVFEIGIDAIGNKWLKASGILIYDNLIFSKMSDKYNVVGDPYLNYIINFCKGPNNGMAFKYTVNGRLMITEIIAEDNIKYYTPSLTGFLSLGDRLYNYNNELYITSSQLTNQTVKFYKFNQQNYQLPFGLVTSDNFKYLDINQVKAAVMNRSDMHWDIGGAQFASYEVPKGKGINSTFAGALWIGGYDASNQLHVGAQTYRQNGFDFWPGPLDTTSAGIDTTAARNYDKIWKVSYTDINTFISNFNNGNVQNSTYTIPENIATWPAHGSGLKSKNLAPFVDYNNDGIYNPMLGDYPKIKGDQALYFIYNDNLAAHQETQALPLGIEVQAMAYAYGCQSTLSGKNELNYTTFYDYKIINRSANAYHDVYTTMWTDTDLGCYIDDYIGCNVADNYGYVYNADNTDEDCAGTKGYGDYPPAMAYAIMKGPLAPLNDGIDNNNDGIIDEPNEDCKLTNFNYFNNNVGNAPPKSLNPANGMDFYNYMTSHWLDSTNVTCGGTGYSGTIPTKWVFPGDPNTATSTDPTNTCGNWTEGSAGNVPTDRRLLVSSGPFNFAPGQMQEVEYALVTSFDSSQANNNILSLAKLKSDVQKVRAFYNQVNKPTCLQNITVGINELVKQTDFNLYPNPTIGILTIENKIAIEKVSYELIDVMGNVVLKSTSSQQKFTIDMSGLSSGVYFVKLTINNSSVVKKVVKQ